jgi:hypothetical protein
MKMSFANCIFRFAFQRQVELPVAYKGIKLDRRYKLDIVVGDRWWLNSSPANTFLFIKPVATYLRLVENRSAYHQLQCLLFSERDVKSLVTLTFSMPRVSVVNGFGSLSLSAPLSYSFNPRTKKLWI